MEKETSRWAVGIITASLIAVASLTFGVTQALRTESISTVSAAEKKDAGDIRELQANYRNINEKLDRVLDLTEKHLGVR